MLERELFHMRINTNLMRRIVGAAVSLSVTMPAVMPTTALAGVPRMPNVTEEMSSASHWSQAERTPDAVLATPEEIAQTNRACLDAGATTCMNDLENWPETEYDGIAYGKALRQAAAADAEYFCSVWARYYTDGDGITSFLSTEDAMSLLYGPMIENTDNLQATENEPIRYALGVNRTCVLSFPSTAPLWDDSTDPDFDYQYQTMLRINEPVIIKGTSNDGRFSHVITSCTQGWVSNDDIAVCADREEWLSAWKTDAEGSDVLVVYDDKIRTETSYYAPEMSNRLLPMGTCLKLAAEEHWGNIRQDINRSGHNCHVVWMPNRADDGSYEPRLALVSENKKVSEGYLPLTASNISMVAMNQLGDCYGWGGMLDSDDCSGYVRDIYRCFGYDLPRNTTWQEAMPVKTYWLGGLPSDGGLSAEKKREIISKLPLGSILIFNGHEMLYLGEEGDGQYVISSISNAFVGGNKVRVRGCVINTLEDITRTDGNTWLDHLTSAKVPFRATDYQDPAYVAIDGDGATWTRGDDALSISFERDPDDGDCLSHFRGIDIDGAPVDASLYEATSGSTVLTLSPQLLNSLGTGDHELLARFDDGDGSASFSIADPELFSVTVVATENGALEATPSQAVEGTNIRITATPVTGYETVEVKIVGAISKSETVLVAKNGAYEFPMPAEDVTVSARFAKKSSGSSDGGKKDEEKGDGKENAKGNDPGEQEGQGGTDDGRRNSNGNGSTSTGGKSSTGAGVLPTSARAATGSSSTPASNPSQSGTTGKATSTASLPKMGDDTDPAGLVAAAVAGAGAMALGIVPRSHRDR